MAASCDAGPIKVRPSGANSTYPHTISTGNPSGFTIKVDLEKEDTTNIQATVRDISLEAPGLYMEWVGTMTGSVNGGRQSIRVASLEAFKLTA
jgi:hypothetical protein